MRAVRLRACLQIDIKKFRATSSLTLDCRKRRVKIQRVNLRLLRLVTAVIALILPVQAMAAAVAGLCMAMGHHEMVQAASHDHATHAGPVYDEPASAEAGDGAKVPHCGPCTACCASVTVAGPAGIALPASISTAPYVFAQRAPPSIPLEGLDRPPLAL